MLRQILLMLSVLLISMTFNGCCKPEIIEVDKPIEVKVPIKCTVPDVNCSWSNVPTHEVPIKMMECIVNLKQARKVCQ